MSTFFRGIKLTLDKAVGVVKAMFNVVMELAVVKIMLKWYSVYKTLEFVVRITYAFYSGDYTGVFPLVTKIIRYIVEKIK